MMRGRDRAIRIENRHADDFLPMMPVTIKEPCRFEGFEA